MESTLAKQECDPPSAHGGYDRHNFRAVFPCPQPVHRVGRAHASYLSSLLLADETGADAHRLAGVLQPQALDVGVDRHPLGFGRGLHLFDLRACACPVSRAPGMWEYARARKQREEIRGGAGRERSQGGMVFMLQGRNGRGQLPTKARRLRIHYWKNTARLTAPPGGPSCL